MNKKMLTIVGVIVAVLLLVILILPSLIDANRYKPEIQSKLGTALGRNVQIGNIKLSIFSGGVVVDDVAISDDPGLQQLAVSGGERTDRRSPSDSADFFEASLRSSRSP